MQVFRNVLSRQLKSSWKIRAGPPLSSVLGKASLQAPRTSFVQPSTTVSLHRYLSTSSSSSLADILKREHTEEVENESTQMPSELQQLKTSLESEHEWKIVDAGAMTKLYRSIEGSMKVQLSFHCQDTVEVLDDDGDYLGGEAEAEEAMEDEAAGPLRF